MGNKGLDIGTNMLVSAGVGENEAIVFKMQRDAFYRITPKSEVNKNSIRMGLEKRGANFIVDGNDFIVVGEDALDIAIERNDTAQRPLQKGILSPKDKSSLPMLKLIIEGLVGTGSGEDKIVYSVPAKPIDTTFDIVYHTEMMGTYLRKMGYVAQPINEGFAIALSELLDDGLTGICLSYGAGMTNVVVIHQGDPLVEFSMTKSGDFIDESVGNALDIPASFIQKEKEAGIDLNKPTNQIMEAISVYYSTVVNYTFDNIAYELKNRKKQLPIFREPVPIVVSGGLTLAKGFEDKVKQAVSRLEFPFIVGDIRRAESPMKAVANGCLLASQL